MPYSPDEERKALDKALNDVAPWQFLLTDAEVKAAISEPKVRATEDPIEDKPDPSYWAPVKGRDEVYDNDSDWE